MNLGALLCQSRHWQEGLEELKVASQQNPDSIMPNRYVTAFFALQQNWAMALSNLTIYRQKAPADPSCDLLSYVIFTGLGRRDEALKARLHYESCQNASLLTSNLNADVLGMFTQPIYPHVF